MGIIHQFAISAEVADVFAAVSGPGGLDAWWTEHCSGQPEMGAEYELRFGPDDAWRARVVRMTPPTAFELEMTYADRDWLGTHVSFRLMPAARATQVRFEHRGWREANVHYATSCYCWAMYLRVLKRHLEHGECVPYDRRLEV